MIVDVIQSEESQDKLVIRMKVQGEVKKKNGEEAIEFPYDLKNDDVEEIVGEMVRGGGGGGGEGERERERERGMEKESV